VIFIWLVIATLIGVAVGLGYLLPGGDQWLYSKAVRIINLRNSSVFIRDSDRQIEQQLTSRYIDNSQTSWSPDGQKIAYVAHNDNLFRVYLMDVTGGNKRQLGVEVTSFYSTYRWSPDSQWILFFVIDEGVAQSLIVNTRTGEKHQLPQTIGAGMWSPDSQNIIYQASAGNGISRLYGMNIQCFAQASPCQFSELDFLGDLANEIKLVWSPDGKHLAYTQFGSNNSKLIVATLRCMDLKATCIESKKTIADISYFVAPIWSTDSKRLAFAASETEVRIIELESGASRSYTLSNGITALQNQRWSPDGHFITFFAQKGNTISFILDTLSGEAYPIFQYQVMIEAPSWRPVPH
jgi:Tol biopolymer transport system component